MRTVRGAISACAESRHDHAWQHAPCSVANHAGELPGCLRRRGCAESEQAADAHEHPQPWQQSRRFHLSSDCAPARESKIRTRSSTTPGLRAASRWRRLLSWRRGRRQILRAILPVPRPSSALDGGGECRPSGRQLAQVGIRGVADLDKLGRDLLPLTEPGGHPVLRSPEQLAEIFGDVHERLFHRRVRTSSPGRAGVRLAIPAGRWSGPLAAFRHDSLLMNGAHGSLRARL